jgi:hypothetical protein
MRTHSPPQSGNKEEPDLDDQTKDNDNHEEGTDLREESKECKEDPFYYPTELNIPQATNSNPTDDHSQDPSNTAPITIIPQNLPVGGDDKISSTNEDPQPYKVVDPASTSTAIPPNESSSVEPTWGTTREPNHQREYEQWMTVNMAKGIEDAYHYVGCQICDTPMVTYRHILTPTCHTCKDEYQREVEETLQLQRHERDEREGSDDEEEFSRIPIAGETEGDYEDSLFDAIYGSENDSSDNETINKTATNNIAFAIGPHRDGIIMPSHPDSQHFTYSNSYTIPTDLFIEPQAPEIANPTWSNHLLRFQRANLRMSYKTKSQLRARLMRQIRKTKHATPPNTQTERQQVTEQHKEHKAPKQLRTHQTGRHVDIENIPICVYLSDNERDLTQCMNRVKFDDPTKTQRVRTIKRTARQSPPHTRHVRTNRSRPTKRSPSWIRPRSPIIVPGTPNSIPDTEATDNKDNIQTTQELEDSDSDDSIEIYYKAYNKFKPEIDESSSESRERFENIAQEIDRLKEEKKTTQQLIKNKEGYNTPEPYNRLHNHSLELDLETPSIRGPEPLNVIVDTGAALSMFPGSVPYAWTDRRPCLYSLTGCFQGDQHNDLEIGKFHAILTLDSGETVRVIIPEAVYIPSHLSHSCLLANTPFLMAGHQYINNLYAPVLKFKQGGKCTLTVKQGHHILRLLPTDATQSTKHRIIYLHNDEPYDPPTFVNETLYQNLNRPCLNTPTAFKIHLRYGCKSIEVLKHTHKHVDGMQIQQGSWNQLASQLPCSACIAGKMRKTRKNPTKEYTEVTNLALSWTASTSDHESRPNERVSLDWGIVNKQYLKDKNNVFALYLDNHTGIVFGYPAASTGQAGPSLVAYIQQYGIPKTIVHDNAQEFIHGEFAQLCKEKSITQHCSPPYHPNQNPTEHYMEIITSTMRSLLFVSGLDPDEFWEHALSHAINIQIRTALPGRCTPYEISYGRRPNIINLRIFGCEALAYIEKDKRKKLQPKVHKTIYLGISDSHDHDTFKLLDIKTKKVIYRKNVYFNERHFPARKTKHVETHQDKPDNGEDLIGQDFEDDGITWTIIKTGLENDSIPILYYQNKETKEEERSTVREVRTWYNRTILNNAVNTIAPSRKGFINNLAEETYNTIMKYDVKLPHANVPKPTSFHKASNNPFPQWFRAEDKERNGMLDFQTWEHLDQQVVTTAIRRKALRCHHLYDIKRDLSAKNRVVVNGSRQHADTYTDTTSPVASQLQTRLFLAIAAIRKYDVTQLDLTNAYLHAPIQDEVYIIIPDGFPRAGEVARLRKAAYGTKQGARRFYDHTANVFKHIGLVQCPNEPCLFRYLHHGDEAFIIQYVDDSLIAGKPRAVKKLEQELTKYFQCKFNPPKDFLGLDISQPKKGEITLSMRSFTDKMASALNFTNNHDGPILTPGRTDKKIVKGIDMEPNEQYRSQVGILNWLTMGVRFDLVYITKELSRVLAEPTKIANELVNRAIAYTIKTRDAHLTFSHTKMTGYQPPPTRKKPTDNAKEKYEVKQYNSTDGIEQEDDKTHKQEYEYKGEPLTLTCQTDIDLAGQVETRQSTSSLVVFLNGTIIHYRAATERVIIQSTAAGEYIALSRGNTTTKFIRDILTFYGNTNHVYYLYTDNQAAEHIATQPNMNEHSRSIDIRHHAIRQDYVDGLMRIGGVDTLDNTADLLTKYLQPPLHLRHTSQLHLNLTNSVTNTHTLLTMHATHTHAHAKYPKTQTQGPSTNTDTMRNLTRQTTQLSRTIILRPQPTHWHTQHRKHQKWNFDPNSHRKSPEPPEFLTQTHRGSTHTSRQPQSDRQYPSRNPSRRHRRTQQHHTRPYTPPATMAHIPPKTSENHPKTRHDRRGDRRTPNLRPHHTHPAHTSMCPTPTPMCHTPQNPAPPYKPQGKHTHCPLLGPSQLSLPRNFECFCQRREATSNKNLRRKRIFHKIKLNTKTHTKRCHKSRHDEKPKFETYRYWKPKICQNGHKFWVQAYTTIQYNHRHSEFPTQHPSDRIPIFSSLRCQHQHFCRTHPDRIRIHPSSLPTAPHYKMCSQKQFLDNIEQYNQRNRTNMGPNTRQEAILDIERDILDSLKRLGKYTTEMSTKKLQTMPYDVFTRKQVALPQFKRLCTRTIRATRDGQQLAPRRTKHDVYYRLFEEFGILLDMQHDLLLEIEESMDSVRHLHEFRKQHLTQHTYEFKPVKNRPPTPAPILTLRDLMDRVPSPSPSYYKSVTPPARSPSGYSSSSSSSSESTTTTVTTTVQHRWTDPDQSSTCSSSPHPDYVY